MEKQKIKSIEKGWGEDSAFYSTDPRIKDSKQWKELFVAEIKEEQKRYILTDCGHDQDIIVYRGYSLDSKLVFEIEANSCLTIIYWEETY